MVNEDRHIVEALKRLPVPEPRPGFIDRAFTRVTSRTEVLSFWPAFLNRGETWVGVAAGALLAIIASLTFMRASDNADAHPITLAVNEVRHIEVLIDSERDLPDTNIHVAAVGGIGLAGFGNQQQLDWRAHLRRGPNLLTLPVVARNSGDGVLLAVVEHAGKRRSVTVNVRVQGSRGLKS
jgi:hypothetical protein